MPWEYLVKLIDHHCGFGSDLPIWFTRAKLLPIRASPGRTRARRFAGPHQTYTLPVGAKAPELMNLTELAEPRYRHTNIQNCGNFLRVLGKIWGNKIFPQHKRN